VEVAQIEGIWRLEDGGRRIAIHARDAHREADAAVTRLLERKPDLVVAIGLGAGYLLDALDRAGFSGKVLALEPQPATISVLESREVARTWLADGRLHVLAAPDFAGASEAWPYFGDGAAEPALFVNPALARVYPEMVTNARTVAVRLRAEAASNAHARQVFGPRYLLNTLRNLPAISNAGDVADLFGTTPDVPAIVIAAGPSLDKALASLRRVQRHALLICVDTTLRPLLAAGISPHLVVSVDPGEANARHLADIPPCPETLLVAEGSLDPLALAPFDGRTFFLKVSDHEPWPWLRQCGRDVGRLRAWGSVLTVAFDLALKMRCNPIVFAGADLAYTEDRPYCRGVVFEEDWRRRAEWGEAIADQWSEAIGRHPRVDESDVNGQPVRTAPHLVAFRNWLLEQMRREPGRRFLNATNGGILQGDAIEQITFECLTHVVSHARVEPPALRARLRLQANGVMNRVARLLAQSESGDAAADAVLGDWQQFAPGASRADIVDALRRAVTSPPHSPAALSLPATPVHAQVAPMDPWLQSLAAATPLVPMHIAAHRMSDWSGVGARIFRFRTLAARLIMASLQPPDGSLLEDGRALKEVRSIHDVIAGTYRTCKDELHFQSSDGTDPRWNGREYVLLVPQCVAALETLPLEQILERRL
jgi:hypothetical protein